jgi:c-di-GMP-binding flagellar brake protein YcgR
MFCRDGKVFPRTSRRNRSARFDAQPYTLYITGREELKLWQSSKTVRMENFETAAERRKYPRLAFDSEVWLGQDGLFTRTTERLSNVSIGGALIETEQGFPEGAIVGLRFALGSISINSTVIVRNVYPGQGIGVEFLDISPEDHNRLQVFIEERVRGRRR